MFDSLHHTTLIEIDVYIIIYIAKKKANTVQKPILFGTARVFDFLHQLRSANKDFTYGIRALVLNMTLFKSGILDCLFVLGEES